MRIDSTGGSFLNLLKESDSALVVANPVAGEEVVASLLALKFLLERMGQKVTLVYPAQLPTSANELPGFAEIRTTLPARSLKVSFGINKTVKKVGYQVKDGVFTMLVEPSEGCLYASNITLAPQPLKIDLAIFLGYSSWQEIGVLAQEIGLETRALPVINIDNHHHNTLYGQLNIVDTSAASIAEILFKAIPSWGLKPTYSSAKCLLYGLGLTDSSS